MGLADINKELAKQFSRTNPDLVFDINRKIDWIPSGNLIYDLVSGGGFPRRRITEISSEEHCGKSSLLMAACAEEQRKGHVCVLFDTEAAFSPDYALETYGLMVDNDTFTLYQPNTSEECTNLFDVLMEKVEKAGVELSIVAFDSIAMIKPKDLITRSADDAAMVGAQARAVGLLFDKVLRASRRLNFAAVFTNQFRASISASRFVQAQTIASGMVNETRTTTGGGAPRYLSSVRMMLAYGGRDDDKTAVDPITGEVGKVKTAKKIKIVNIKNRLHRPELMGYTHFVYPKPEEGVKGGWSRGQDIIELLKQRGRIQQRATKFIYNGLQIPEWTSSGCSAVASEEKFMNTPELMKDAEELIKQLVNNKLTPMLDKAQVGVDFSAHLTEGQNTKPEDISIDTGDLSDFQSSDDGEMKTISI